MVFIAVLGLLACVSWQVQCSEYDHSIKAAWRRYLPLNDWRIGWAQIQQESSGRVDAISPVGAEGLAQFMPRTWDDMQLHGIVPRGASAKDARYAIQAQAYYLNTLRQFWRGPRSETDRIRLALASYNAGAGNILKSQKKCGNVNTYNDIMACLSMVTGRHAVETNGYVPAIERHYKRRFHINMEY